MALIRCGIDGGKWLPVVAQYRHRSAGEPGTIVSCILHRQAAGPISALTGGAGQGVNQIGEV